MINMIFLNACSHRFGTRSNLCMLFDVVRTFFEGQFSLSTHVVFRHLSANSRAYAFQVCNSLSQIYCFIEANNITQIDKIMTFFE